MKYAATNKRYSRFLRKPLIDTTKPLSKPRTHHNSVINITYMLCTKSHIKNLSPICPKEYSQYESFTFSPILGCRKGLNCIKLTVIGS